ALQQFFFDGNKRTSRFMMNGVLMSAGIDAISVPAAKAQEFNHLMVDFYLTKDASQMMAFLVECHPDAQKIKALNEAQKPQLEVRRLSEYRASKPARSVLSTDEPSDDNGMEP
ncbi:hypothetical protein J7431_21440, partial [Xanthomonas phaseoli pv. dieffenbachiae]|nr:hypothetical protein [Xanthomonas phaseoli pv. dieffenbachiae]MBO9753769.1 hypothetical protein [Xanthomonas phaseoli pv. dieffenbachiae]